MKLIFMAADGLAFKYQRRTDNLGNCLSLCYHFVNGHAPSGL